MTILVSDIPVNARVRSLREKHKMLSAKVEEALKTLSSTDNYISQLKKEKLLIKEKIEEETRRYA